MKGHPLGERGQSKRMWREGTLQGKGRLAWGALASLAACLIPPTADEDECRAQPSLCANGRCVNTVGSFQCDCDKGFQLSPAGTECHGECGQAWRAQPPPPGSSPSQPPNTAHPRASSASCPPSPVSAMPQH